MHRTFPDNVLFRNAAEPCLQRALYNVLLAYGHHNKAVGYCQVKNTLPPKKYTTDKISHTLSKEQEQIISHFTKGSCGGGDGVI